MKDWMLAALAALVLTGCATVHVDPTVEGKPAAGADLTPLPQIVAGAELTARTDSIKNGSELIFSTGKVFSKVFTGQVGAPGQMELISAKCEELQIESWVIAKTNLRYTVTVSLDVSGRRHILIGTGTGATHHSYPDAMRQAVEIAAADLAKQAKALL